MRHKRHSESFQQVTTGRCCEKRDERGFLETLPTTFNGVRVVLRLISRLLCMACLVLSTSVVRAGAFLLPEGEGQFIAGIGYSEGSRGFDPPGHLAPSPRKAEASGYLEYGLTPWLSLILAPTLAHEFGSSATNLVTGSDSSALGARVQLYGSPGQVIALQALVEPPIGSASEGGATDIRLMLGQVFPVHGWSAFVDIEPGLQLRSDPLPTAARLDATAGIRPRPNFMVLLQSFTSLTPSAGSADRQSYSKLQISGVYDVSAVWSIQAGAFRTIAGRKALRETGPLAALWYRF